MWSDREQGRKREERESMYKSKSQRPLLGWLTTQMPAPGIAGLGRARTRSWELQQMMTCTRVLWPS